MQVDHHLHITAAYKNEKTFLKNCFYKQPFKLANITEYNGDKALRLMIMSSSPGILNNDHHSISINLEENALVHLTTQGYQRLFSMAGNASQQTNVNLNENSFLVYLPHPVTPHTAACFSSINNIFLKTNHTLLWSEIITCGRKLNGEQFSYTRFQNVTNVFLNKKLVIKENILLEPAKNNIQSLGQLEGYTHQSTLLFISSYININRAQQDALDFLAVAKDVCFGISSLPVSGIIIRILGNSAETLFNYNRKLAALFEQPLVTAQ